MTREQRTVLAPDVGREQFEDLALLAGWRLYRVIERTDDTPYEQIWTIDNGTSSIHYVEDDLVGVTTVLTRGDREDELTELVTQRLSTLTPTEVLVWAYAVEDAAERVKAIGYLAALAPPQPEDAFVAVLETALQDSRAEVRRAALFACAYLSWPEVVPLVEAVRHGDPDEATRSNAAQVLEAILRHRDPTS